MNIFAEEIYIGKFKPGVGVYRIEQKIVDRKDTDISNDHLVAYRVRKEEIIYNWLLYLRKVIENYFANTGRLYEQNRMFQEPFPDQLWKNIRNFIRNLKALPLARPEGLLKISIMSPNYKKSINLSGMGHTGPRPPPLMPLDRVISRA